MVKPRRNKVATEAFVYRLFSQLDKKIDSKIDELREGMNKKFDKIMEHLVNLAGQFKKFGEEQTVLSERSKNHEDRIGKLEDRAFKAS